MSSDFITTFLVIPMGGMVVMQFIMWSRNTDKKAWGNKYFPNSGMQYPKLPDKHRFLP
jgi:hypothetical protein